MSKRFKSLKGLRLGQAIYCAIANSYNHLSVEELFYIEDDELLDLIKKLCKERK